MQLLGAWCNEGRTLYAARLHGLCARLSRHAHPVAAETKALCAARKAKAAKAARTTLLPCCIPRALLHALRPNLESA